MKKDRKELSAIKSLVRTALGEIPSDLVLKNCKVVNVFSEEIFESDISIVGDRIASISRAEKWKKVLNCDGLYAIPGLMDGHVHLDSTLLTPSQLARILLPHGTTTVFIDPHEIANVLGMKGIRLLIREARSTPLKVYVQFPSRVPTAPRLETTGAVLGLKETLGALRWVDTISLGELDPSKIFPPKDEYLLKVIATGRARKVKVGHAAGLSGKKLEAYASVGMADDHECTNAEEALERIGLGMKIIVREGSSERNLVELVKVITKYHKDPRNLFFCTDDKHPNDILREGHINYNVRKAIENGVDPIKAIQMASINCAEHFRVDTKLGSITPGKIADMLLMRKLEEMKPSMVIASGELIAKDGKFLGKPKAFKWPKWSRTTVRMKKKARSQDFRITSDRDVQKVWVMKIVEGQITNKAIQFKLPVKDGSIQIDLENDVLKIACIERHKRTGNIGIGFVKGFNLKKGAIASSVAHDHHNLVAVGTNDVNISASVNALEKMQGGFVVVKDGKVLEKLPLPIAGLLSPSTSETVIKSLDGLNKAARMLGCKLKAPFMTLSFVSLPTVPELGLTDMGLVNVKKHKIINVKIL